MRRGMHGFVDKNEKPNRYLGAWWDITCAHRAGGTYVSKRPRIKGECTSAVVDRCWRRLYDTEASQEVLMAATSRLEQRHHCSSRMLCVAGFLVILVRTS
jgi:hypothetical protein